MYFTLLLYCIKGPEQDAIRVNIIWVGFFFFSPSSPVHPASVVH